MKIIASKVTCACTECPCTGAGKGAFGVPSITTYDDMLKAAAAGPVPVAIAAAQEHKVLIATSEAQSRGIIQAILVGDARGIHQIADEHGWLV